MGGPFEGGGSNNNSVGDGGVTPVQPNRLSQRRAVTSALFRDHARSIHRKNSDAHREAATTPHSIDHARSTHPETRDAQILLPGSAFPTKS